MSTTKVVTPLCCHCNQTGSVKIPQKDFDNGMPLYLAGHLIHIAFPNQSIETREQMISGIHPECWKKMFPAF